MEPLMTGPLCPPLSCRSASLTRGAIRPVLLSGLKTSSDEQRFYDMALRQCGHRLKSPPRWLVARTSEQVPRTPRLALLRGTPWLGRVTAVPRRGSAGRELG